MADSLPHHRLLRCLGGRRPLIWPSYPIVALLSSAFIVALQSSLMHEVLHGHPTRNGLVNEAFVFLPIGLVWPFRRFKALHLRHHADERLTDPFDDPESYYQALWQHDELPAAMKVLLTINNTMIGRFVLGPWLAMHRLLHRRPQARSREGDRRSATAWVLHAARPGDRAAGRGLSASASRSGSMCWCRSGSGQWLISIRTFAEHQWSERPEGRTIIVERSPLAFLFLNNNLHLVHHTNPTVAWYRLPKMFRDRREEWVRDEQRLCRSRTISRC